MSWEEKDFAINVAFSLVLHFLVFAGVFLTPSLYRQRFSVPVAYEVKLVELPGVRQTTPSRKKAPAVKVTSQKASPQITPSTPPPKTKASKAKTQAPPTRPDALTLPGKEKAARKPPQSPQPTTPPQIAQAAVPTVLPAPPRRGGAPAVISESSVSTAKADPSLSYYLAAIQTKISSRWIEPSLNINPGQVERVTLGFTVLRSGLVRDIQVLDPSDSVFLDQSALRAIQEAVPLPPFPPLFPEETLQVRFHFEMRGE